MSQIYFYWWYTLLVYLFDPVEAKAFHLKFRCSPILKLLFKAYPFLKSFLLFYHYYLSSLHHHLSFAAHSAETIFIFLTDLWLPTLYIPAHYHHIIFRFLFVSVHFDHLIQLNFQYFLGLSYYFLHFPCISNLIFS